MKMIVPRIKVSEKTVAVIPAFDIDYQSIVIEQDATYKVAHPPFAIIEQACLDNGSTYDGRRHAVIHYTGFKRKVPIIINYTNKLLTFPTHAPTDMNCCWLFHKHIAHIREHKTKANQTDIIFRNGMILTTNLSPYSLKKQIERTLTSEEKTFLF